MRKALSASCMIPQASGKNLLLLFQVQFKVMETRNCSPATLLYSVGHANSQLLQEEAGLLRLTLREGPLEQGKEKKKLGRGRR